MFRKIWAAAVLLATDLGFAAATAAIAASHSEPLVRR